MNRWNTPWSCLLGLALVAALTLDVGADELDSLERRFNQTAERRIANDAAPNFRRHIVPLLGRMGCNGRACHGSFQGQGGFRLSMFGFDFVEDHKSLVDSASPRVKTDNALDSLILRKPTSDDDHEGGKRFEADGWEFHALKRWIEAGAKDDSAQVGQLLRLQVTPRELVFTRKDESIPLKVVAVWDDGLMENVTCLTRFSSTDESVVVVDAKGSARASGTGDAHVIASYDSGVVDIPAMLPIHQFVGGEYPHVLAKTQVDRLVCDKLKKLGIVPAEICSDEEFLRRVSLDITGTLPTPEEIQCFLADDSPDKRNTKIDELLNRPAYSVWWGTLFCDYTGLNAPLQLGNTDFAKPVGDQWTAWIERKLRDNVPYDKIVEGIVVATSRTPGQSYEEFAWEQSQFTRTKEPVDFTAQDQMPHFWQRDNIKDPDQKALAFAYSFLGVRLDCAQCHKHPFDQWTKQDFDQFAACFAPIRKGISPECEPAYNKMVEELGITKNTTAAERRGKYLRLAAEGKPAPWREVFIGQPEKPMPPDQSVAPKILGGELLALGEGEDPRVKLMAWLRSKDNPYFARAIINRVWAQYFGRGIVDPPDDQNLGNPPCNAPLLEYLASGFIEHGFDIKWLDRFAEKATAMIMSDRARIAFDTHRESPSITKLFAADDASQSLLLAARLVEHGVRFVTVTLDAWDTHLDNFKNLKNKLLPPFDSGITALVQALEDKGLLERTLVIATGEFGRTPKINSNAGRDHWPRTMWTLAAGGGVGRGNLVGGTDAKGHGPDDSTQMSPDDLAASIYHALGIDHRLEYVTRSGRPAILVAEGKVISQLFA